MTAVDSRLSTFTSTSGDNLALQEWPLPDGVAPRGVVLIVHGLGEHAGRYDALGQFLVQRGFSVRAYDHFGHGQSSGRRGTLSSNTRLLDDLDDMVDATRERMHNAGLSPKTPLILLGHSMGGLVAARFVSQRAAKVDALVLSSPALDAGMSAAQKVLLWIAFRLFPDLPLGNGLKAQFISHDADVVKAYIDDPQVHDRISARLAQFIASAGPATLAAAPQWTVPTLLMYAGDDRLLAADGSRRFAQAAPSGVVTSHCWEGLWHEIFNEREPERSQVFDMLGAWLARRW